MIFKGKLSFRMRIAICTALVLCFSSIFMWIGWNLSSNFVLNQVSEELQYKELIPYENNNSVKLLELDKIHNASHIQMIIWVSITILIGSFITYKISDISIKPLKKLSDTMENMTVNTFEKIPCSAVNDELQQVTNSFNKMVDNLEKSFERERQFSANVAHELRTPLAVMLTKYEVFEMQNNSQISEYQYVLDVSKKKIEYLHTMVENLLSLYRNDEKLTIEKVNIATMLFDIVEMLEEKADKKQIITEINCEDIYVNCDINLLTCAIHNIIDNSIVYNKANGEIDISSSIDGGMLKILIKDTGIGIEAKDSEDIFNPFYQVKSSENIGKSHCGLGLSLAKKIIVLHGGNIEVESRVGVGSQFKIVIPF